MKNVQSSQQGEAHNQSRNRLGSISGHQHLMSQKSDDSGRREEIKRFSESWGTREKIVHREIEENRAEAVRIMHWHQGIEQDEAEATA